MKRLDELKRRSLTTADKMWLLARVRELEAVVRDCEYAGDFCDEPACPKCCFAAHQGHAVGCALAAALRALDAEEAE